MSDKLERTAKTVWLPREISDKAALAGGTFQDVVSAALAEFVKMDEFHQWKAIKAATNKYKKAPRRKKVS
jgi:hypothetical protein